MSVFVLTRLQEKEDLDRNEKYEMKQKGGRNERQTENLRLVAQKLTGFSKFVCHEQPVNNRPNTKQVTAQDMFQPNNNPKLLEHLQH